MSISRFFSLNRAPLVASAVLMALGLAVSSAGYANEPEAAEQPVTLTGELEVVVGDDWERGRSDIMHFVRDAASGEVLRLRFSGKLPANARSGARVNVRGSLRGRELFLEANGTGGPDLVVVDGAGTEAAMTGQQKTLVMVAGFADKPVSCSTADVADTMFTGPDGTTVDDLYQEMSFGAVDFVGEVHGPYVLESTDSSACDTYAWASEMDSLAAADGVNLNNFSRKVYVVPRGTGCNYAGLGNVGGSNTRAWILRCELPDVYAHELGHNLGMGHAATTSSAYGDSSDIMGISGLKLRQLNGPHKEQMGWTPSGRITDVTGDGVYDLSPLELPAAQAPYPQILKVSKPDSGESYYLSYRESIGFDANLAWDYRDQLSVHRYVGSGSSKTYLLATLEDGQSYVDDANGITFTQLSHVPGQLTVDIQQSGSGCSVNSPTVAVTPGSQSALPGGTLAYQVQVSNRDGGGCGTSGFSLSAGAPSGWTATISPASLTLAAGQTASATLSVTSGANAAAGNYAVTTSVSDAGTTGHDGSGSATYAVETGCTASAPDVSLSPASQSDIPGGTLEYTMQVTNRDSAACAATSFATGGSAPAGWTLDVSPSALSLQPGQSGTGTVFVTAATDAAAGDYQFSVAAEDSGAAGHGGTADGLFTVVPGCIESRPFIGLSPAYQSSVAGDSLVYALYLTNTDTAECSATTWALLEDVAAGLGVDMTVASMTLQPGETGTATVTATADASLNLGDYDFKIRAVDNGKTGHNNNRTGTFGVVEQTGAGDTEAPTAPDRPKASYRRNDSVVRLSWQAATDNVAVAGYRVFRDGSLLATTTRTVFADLTIVPGAAYYITAYDAAGNESAASRTVRLKGGGKH